MTVPLSSGVVRAFDGVDAHDRLLADGELVDVLRHHLRFEVEGVVDRHDQHGGLGRGDHAADRVDGELMHVAGARRADVDPLQLVLGRDLALDELRDLGLDLAQLLHHLGAHLLVDLDDLQRGLGDLALGLRDAGDDLAALALEARRLALERRQARELAPGSSGRARGRP